MNFSSFLSLIWKTILFDAFAVFICGAFSKNISLLIFNCFSSCILRKVTHSVLNVWLLTEHRVPGGMRNQTHSCKLTVWDSDKQKQDLISPQNPFLVHFLSSHGLFWGGCLLKLKWCFSVWNTDYLWSDTIRTWRTWCGIKRCFILNYTTLCGNASFRFTTT